MDNKEKLSGSEDKDEKGVKPEENPSINEIKSGASAKKERKTKKRNNKKAIRPEVIIAAITAVATIITTTIVALPSLLPYFASIQPSPTPTFTSTSSPTPFIADTFTPVFTDTPTFVAPPLSTSTSTSTATITVTPPAPITPTPAPILIIQLSYDKSAGRSPLTVKFDARESYLLDSDRKQHPCKYGSCNFTWKVILDNRQLSKSTVDSSGRLQYTFEKPGRFLIALWVCRKDVGICAGAGVYILVG